MTANRNYSAVARLSTLTAPLSGSATSMTVDVVTGWPTVPATFVIDPGRAAEEIITITGIVGTTIAIQRGQDGTGGQPHDAGAQVRHMATARDFREAAEHIGNTSSVHGVSGFLVGTTDGQVLDNKTFQSATTDHTALTVQAGSGQSTAPLVLFLDASGNTKSSMSLNGVFTSNGFNATSTTTLATSDPSQPAVILKNAVGQSGDIFSHRDSAGVGVNMSINNGGYVKTPGVMSSAQSTFAGSSTTVSPILIQTPLSSSVPIIDVRNSLSSQVAGILGETGTYQLYHGGATSNLVPFKVHGGTVNVTMLNGATSQSGTIDLSSYGFTVAPLMTLTVRQDNVSTLQRRVGVNMEGAPSSGSCTFRVVQTSNELMPSNTAYVVHWIAWQLLPSSAAG
jgi:hypothetical protein